MSTTQHTFPLGSILCPSCKNQRNLFRELSSFPGWYQCSCGYGKQFPVPDKRTLYRTAIVADNTLGKGYMHDAFARGACVSIVCYNAYNDSYDIMSQGLLLCNVAPEQLEHFVL